MRLAAWTCDGIEGVLGGEWYEVEGVAGADASGLLTALVAAKAGGRKLSLVGDMAMAKYVNDLNLVAAANEFGPGCTFSTSEPRRGKDSLPTVIMPATLLRKHEDVVFAVERVMGGVAGVLGSMGYEQSVAGRWAATFSEASQNVPEHAASDGIVAVELASYPATVLRVVVVDGGVGVKRSLESDYPGGVPPRGPAKGKYDAGHFADDAEAIATAFKREGSRFRDEGRGLGLTMLRDVVCGWGGSVVARSGSCRLDYSGGTARGRAKWGLVEVPGFQLTFCVPEKSGRSRAKVTGRVA